MRACPNANRRAATRVLCCASLAVMSALAACADMSDFAGTGPQFDTGPGPLDTGPGPVDTGPSPVDADADDGGQPGPCANDEFLYRGDCVGPLPSEPADVCEFVDSLDAECTDLDGDCFVGSCDRPVPDDLAAAIFDCDDHRPARHPLASELCNEADDDCDGLPDEDFEIGAPCETACGPGKLECAADNAARVACSTAAGQSAYAPAEELCNGLDDDCDGVPDDLCRVPLPADAVPMMPAVCEALGTALLVVDANDGGIWWIRETADPDLGADGRRWDAERLPAARTARWPTCSAAGFAWIEQTGDCQFPDDGPQRCEGALWIQATDGAPADMTGRDSLGPPVAHEGDVFWHAVRDGRPTLLRRRIDAQAPGLDSLGDDYSDPSPGTKGVAVRRWTMGAAEIRLLDERGEIRLPGPDGAIGAPAQGDSWVVWRVGRTDSVIWGVEIEMANRGFQITDAVGPQWAPRLDGTRLVWLDGRETPPALTELELTTGVGTPIVRTDIAVDNFAVGRGVTTWIAEGPDGPSLYLHRVAATEPP